MGRLVVCLRGKRYALVGEVRIGREVATFAIVFRDPPPTLAQ